MKEICKNETATKNKLRRNLGFIKGKQLYYKTYATVSKNKTKQRRMEGEGSM